MHVILPWRSEISYYEGLVLKQEKTKKILGDLEIPYLGYCYFDPHGHSRSHLCYGEIGYIDNKYVRYGELHQCDYLRIYVENYKHGLFCDKDDFIKWMKEFKYNGFLEKVKECMELHNTMIKLT
eukprot:gene7455-11780_t